jgi:hypothetical protein
MKLKNIGTVYDGIYAGHQDTPLYKPLIDDYITCAKTIIKETDKPIKNSSVIGKTYRSTYGKATIAYDKERIHNV